MPHALLISSPEDVLGQRTETAVRAKMRRNENTPLCCISCCSSHPAFHLPTPICRAPAMQPGVALAKMEAIWLENVGKGHGKATELYNQVFQLDGWTQSLRAPLKFCQLRRLSLPSRAHGKQVCGESLEGHSAFSGCFSSRERTPPPRKCSATCLLPALVKNCH